jgi:hypothetical protein
VDPGHPGPGGAVALTAVGVIQASVRTQEIRLPPRCGRCCGGTSIRMTARSPVLGLGLVNYKFHWADPSFIPITRLAAGWETWNLWGFAPPSHNLFVDVYAQTGLLGLGLFLWGMIAMLYVLIKTLRRTPPGGFTRAYVTSILCGFIAMLIGSFVFRRVAHPLCLQPDHHRLQPQRLFLGPAGVGAGDLLQARGGTACRISTDNPEVSIVMVNLNQADYTAQCLDSLRQAPPTTPYEIILVDNGSTDGSGQWIADRYPEVKLVFSPVNIGYRPGNNLGIRASQGEFVLLLNNDTLVVPPGRSTVCGVPQSPSRGRRGGRQPAQR